MTWLMWVGLVLVLLAFAAVGLAALGARRWADRMGELTRALETARADGAVEPRSPTHYDAHELEGLPAPVQRYFRAALKDGQAIVSAVTIEMAGTINMSATAEQWKAFTSKQRVVTSTAGFRPGFMWDARISMLPGMKVHVLDAYIAGKGLLRAAMLGLFVVADMGGGGEMARGDSCASLPKHRDTRLRCCPARVCNGRRWTAAQRMPASTTVTSH